MNIPKLKDLKGVQFTEKHFRFHYPEFLEFLNEKYKDQNLTFQEKLYWYFNNLSEQPKCKCCGNLTKFENTRTGYREYCSYKCLNSDPDKKAKVEATCIEKFGTKAPAQSKQVINKMKQTTLKRYGVENAMKNKDIAKKSKDAMIEKYGGCGNASEELLQKYKDTNMLKYGVDNYAITQECRDKMKDTCIEKYGVEHYSKTEDFKNKIISHNQKKYGVNSYTQTEEYKEKTLQTNQEKYGVEHYSKTDEYKERTKQTNLERYGCENIMKVDGIKEKIKQSYINNYGVEHYAKSKEFYEKLPSTLQKIYNTKKTNNSFNTSQVEEDFAEWLTENDIVFERQYRDKRYPFNCDFYFPDKDLYLEIQGSWTHGFHPYNENDPDDIRTIKTWTDKQSEFYNNAIDVWTRRDPLKRETAKKNNLNWIEVFSNDLEEVIKAYNSY